jgi:hypothetical protein
MPATPGSSRRCTASAIDSSPTRADILALFAGLSLASPVDSWQDLHEARLAEALDHDTPRAEKIYRRLIQSLAADDPIREEALYSLGNSLYASGYRDDAVSVLVEGLRTARSRARFQDLLQLIELDQTSIREVPTTWDFEDDLHGILHPWGYQDKGILRVASVDGNRVLAWSTTVVSGEEDQVLVGIHRPDPAPSGLRFDIGATQFDSWVEVAIYDDLGEAWVWGGGRIRARTGLLLTFDLPMSGFRRASDAPGQLDPATANRLVIRDVTAFHGESTGEHALLFDDFSVY